MIPPLASATIAEINHSFRAHTWTQQIDPLTWLHSSVGRALHRQQKGHDFEPRWKHLKFFRYTYKTIIEIDQQVRGSFLNHTTQTFFSTVFPFTSSKFSQGENFVFILAQRNMAAVMKTRTPATLIWLCACVTLIVTKRGRCNVWHVVFQVFFNSN